MEEINNSKNIIIVQQLTSQEQNKTEDNSTVSVFNTAEYTIETDYNLISDSSLFEEINIVENDSENDKPDTTAEVEITDSNSSIIYYNINSVDSSAKDTSDNELIPASAAMPIISEIVGSVVDSFDGESKDGKISATKQCATGDCWILSAINSLSYSEEGQKIIEECLDYQDGYTTVHLAVGDIIVTDEELIGTKGSLQYSSGDDDMIIFELAIEKVLDDIANGKLKLSEDAVWFLEDESELEATKIGKSSADGGFSIEALYYITGITGDYTNDKDKINEELDKFAENNGKDYILTASISSESEKTEIEDINGEEVKLIKSHVYSIKSADEDTVTIVNPWDSNEEIVISKETFLEVFTNVYSLDLTQESNNGEYVIHSEDYTKNEKIEGIKYIADYDYDDDGNLISKTIHTEDGGAGIQYTYDENGNEIAKLCEVDSNGDITEVYSWDISDEQLENILERGLLTPSISSSSSVIMANDVYCSGLADIDDEQWQKIEKFMDFTDRSGDGSNLQWLGQIAKYLTDEEIEKAYELLQNNSTATFYDVFCYIEFGTEL